MSDTIFKVGCDLYQKLSPEDRLVAPIIAAKRINKPYDMIFEVLQVAISFKAIDENGNYFPSDKKFFKEAEKGVEYVLQNICKL